MAVSQKVLGRGAVIGRSQGLLARDGQRHTPYTIDGRIIAGFPPCPDARPRPSESYATQGKISRAKDPLPVRNGQRAWTDRCL